jgi:hypothetical protein
MDKDKVRPASLGKYVGQAVYDGIRVLTPKEVERLKRAREESEKNGGGK